MLIVGVGGAWRKPGVVSFLKQVEIFKYKQHILLTFLSAEVLLVVK
jgi:hypothetical protein